MNNPFREDLVSRSQAESCTIVIFGATGDLTHRKLVPAMYNLAVLHEDEAAGMVDKAKAVKLYQKAADLEHTAAQYNLAWSYEHGEGGLTKNIAEAIKYYRKAAENGSAEAKKALNVLEW